MTQTTKSIKAVQVVDLILEPERYHDALISSTRRRCPRKSTVGRITEMLPLAIAQLDTVGDEHGALALEDLYVQLMRLQPTA